jgi:transcriptional regulator with XRE-family HTH domain
MRKRFPSARPPADDSETARRLHAARAGRTAGQVDDVALALGLTSTKADYPVPPKDRDSPATQAHIASYLPVSTRTLRNYESGRTKPAAQQLPELAALLGLDVAEVGILFRLCTGRDPQPYRKFSASIAAPWRAVIADSQWPMYVLTLDTWHVVLANDAYERLYGPFCPFQPGEPDAILLRMVLTEGAQQVMVNHSSDWAGRLVGMIAASWMKSPDDPYLFALVTMVTSDPRWQHLWRNRLNPLPWPDLDERELRHPEWGHTQVVLLSWQIEHLGQQYRALKVVPRQWVDDVLAAES